MTTMNEYLAEFYGTNQAVTEKTASAPEIEEGEQEKVALFAKLAKDNNLDISSLSDEQLDTLYQQTFSKEATYSANLVTNYQTNNTGTAVIKLGGTTITNEGIQLSKEAEDARLEKQAEEADFMGRIMAHAYVNEMRKIASAAEEASREVAKPEEKTATLRDRLLKIAEDEKKEKEEEKKEEKSEKKDEKPMPPWMKEKEASALNEASVEQALSFVQEYNKTAVASNQAQFDVKLAAERLSAVHTLGLAPSEKVASAQDAEQAKGIRALEYLEAAGYPVTWA